jgi:cytosine deaminase
MSTFHVLWHAVSAAQTSSDQRPGIDPDTLVLPAFADPHVHLDKALTADLVHNSAGDLAGAIDAWLAFRPTQSTAAVHARARRGALELLRHGTTAVRAHADAGPGVGTQAVEALVALRSELAGIVDVQVVAGVGPVVTGTAGAGARAALAAALEAGADLVGGAPALDPDPAGAYDVLVAAALEAGVGLDLHVDETLDPGTFTLPWLIDRVAGGFPHPVVVDHVVSLAVQPPAVRDAVAQRLAKERIGVITLPATNLYLQGRGPATPTARGLTAIRTLLDAGVTVAAGADNVRDPFNPTGRFDPLETASLLVIAGHLTADEALTAVTTAPRALLGLPPAGPGDVVALPASSVSDAIAGASPQRTVRRDGRVVAQTTITTWAEGAA